MLPHDAYGRDRGLFIKDRLPFILGADVAGTIIKTGSDQNPFKVGDEVFGMENLFVPEPNQAGLQEYALLETNAIAKVPASIQKEEAVTMPINLVTAFMSLFTEKFGFGLTAPWEQTSFDHSAQTIVILAAGSNVGKSVIELAKIVGVGRVIAVAGPSNQQELKRLGATHFIDRHASNEKIKSQIDAIAGPDNLQRVLDCYSWTYELAEFLVSKTKPSHVRVLHLVDGAEIAARKPLAQACTVSCSNANLAPHAEEFWKHVPKWLAEKKILPAPYRIIEGLEKVEDINKALDDYRDAKGGP